MLEILQVFLQVILGITSLLLTLLILLHRGRGGGLSDLAASEASGVRKSAVGEDEDPVSGVRCADGGSG